MEKDGQGNDLDDHQMSYSRFKCECLHPRAPFFLAAFLISEVYSLFNPLQELREMEWEEVLAGYDILQDEVNWVKRRVCDLS